MVLFGLLLGFGIMILVLMLISLIAIIWALIDIANQKGKDAGWKIIWLLICIFLGVIGVIIYYFASGRKSKSK